SLSCSRGSEDAIRFSRPCSARLSDSSARMQTRTHELSHVVRVEERSFRFSCLLQALFELGQRVAPALGMGIIGREHEQLGARLLHHPTDRLAWERREIEMAADVHGWGMLQE